MKRKVTKWMRLRWMIRKTMTRPGIQAMLAEHVRKNTELLTRLRRVK